MFDEPTTGLHFEDVARLVRAFGAAARGRPFAAGDRAQPRGDRRRRLDHRPGARGRRAGGELVAAGTPQRSWRGRARTPARRCARSARTRSRRPAAPPARVRPSPAATAPPGARRSRSACAARASTTCENIRCRGSARTLHRHHRRFGFRKIHAGLRHPVQRRPAPLSRIAQRLRAAVRAAGRATRPRCHPRHSAHGGDRAARQPRWAQEHGRDADRDLSFPAADVRAPGDAVLPRLRSRRSRRRARSASSRSCCASIAAGASSCWRR